MASKIFSLISIVGVILLGIAGFCFFFRAWPLGIHPVFLEGIGVAMIALVLGKKNNKLFLMVVLAAVVAAVFLDPLIWGMHRLPKGPISPALSSLIINCILGLIIVMFYFLGRIINKKFLLR